MYHKTVFLGDSITEGYGVPRSACWVHGLPGNNINRGISGDTTAGMLRRFVPHVLAEQPDRVVIMAGLNDFGEGKPWSTAADNLQRMCTMADGAGIEVVLGIYPQPDYDEFLSSDWVYVLPGIRTLPEQFDRLCEWLRDFARQRGYQCLDFRTEFPKRLTMDYCRYFLEGEHPNTFGHEIMHRIARESLYPTAE